MSFAEAVTHPASVTRTANPVQVHSAPKSSGALAVFVPFWIVSLCMLHDANIKTYKALKLKSAGA